MVLFAYPITSDDDDPWRVNFHQPSNDFSGYKNYICAERCHHPGRFSTNAPISESEIQTLIEEVITQECAASPARKRVIMVRTNKLLKDLNYKDPQAIINSNFKDWIADKDVSLPKETTSFMTQTLALFNITPTVIGIWGGISLASGASALYIYYRLVPSTKTVSDIPFQDDKSAMME